MLSCASVVSWAGQWQTVFASYPCGLNMQSAKMSQIKLQKFAGIQDSQWPPNSSRNPVSHTAGRSCHKSQRCPQSVVATRPYGASPDSMSRSYANLITSLRGSLTSQWSMVGPLLNLSNLLFKTFYCKISIQSTDFILASQGFHQSCPSHHKAKFSAS